MKKIVFDIDGTVVDFHKPLKFYFKKMFGLVLPDEAFSRKKIAELTNVSQEKILNCINTCFADVEKQKLYPGARDFIVDYYKKTCSEVLFVTTRWDKDSTYKLLSNYFYDIFYDVVFVTESKVPALKKVGAEVYIEDRIESAEEVSNAGIFTILLERPWNQFGTRSSTNLVRVKDWFELKKTYSYLLE